MNQTATDDSGRCPNCDSKMPPGTPVCLMCGAEMVVVAPVAPRPAAKKELKPSPIPAGTPPTPALAPPNEPPLVQPKTEEIKPSPIPAGTPVPPTNEPTIIQAVMHERQYPLVFWMTAVVVFITAILAVLVVRHAGPVSIVLFPTLTPIPPTLTFTPTLTPVPSQTPLPSETPTITPSPTPTFTPAPPREYQVTAGDTLYVLSLRYNVSIESIAQNNSINAQSPIQAGQNLLIPWPTATPPLTAVSLTINGETVIADPNDCQRYTIQSGDAISVIAGQFGINFELLMLVNRLTEQSIIQPGDTICIPQIIRSGILPPTAGPSPTPTPTTFPAGPHLLYPLEQTVIESVEQTIALQWVAVKDLADDEWYMVELTDLSEPDSHALRAFTRQNSFQAPSSWRPPIVEYHQFRWRVSIVQVTGQRQDGTFIYTYAGRPSSERTFTWLGAIPTPTPTPTPTLTPTPVDQ